MDPPPSFHSQTLPKNGNSHSTKKTPYWIPTPMRSTLPGTNSSQLSSEYESDDSGRYNTATSFISKVARRNREMGPIRVNYDSNQINGYHVKNINNLSSPYNKRSYDGNRLHYNSLRLPTVSLPYLHQIAPDRFLSKSHLMEIKDVPRALKNGSKWDRLSEELWNKFMKSRQTEEIFQNKMALWKFLYVNIKNSHPQYSLYLVGSTITGFGINNSDMDLCLVVKTQEFVSYRCQALTHLDTILRFIRALDAFSAIEFIRATVPILKFRDRQHQLEVDLNCNNIVGIRNTHLIYSYAQLDWRVRPLVVIVKLWAQHHRINNPKDKSISSYSFVLMVLHYLQYGTHPKVLPNLQQMYPSKFKSDQDIHLIDIFKDAPVFVSSNTETLGELFLGFLKYYSKFEYSSHTISVRTGGVLSVSQCRARDAHQKYNDWKFLCIEEPFDLSNTARSVYDFSVFSNVLRVFRESASKLEKDMTIGSLLPP